MCVKNRRLRRKRRCVFLLFLLSIAVFAGRAAVLVFETFVEGVSIRKATFFNNLIDGEIAVFQQLAAMLQPHVHNVVGKAHIKRLLEQTAEIRGVVETSLRQIVQGNFFR